MAAFPRRKQLSPEAQCQRRLALYAQLASLPSLDTLTDREKCALLHDVSDAGYELLDAAAFLQWQREHPAAAARLPKTVMSKEDAEKAWNALQGQPSTIEGMVKAARHVNLVRMWEREEPLPTYWNALQVAHPWAQKLICSLLKGDYVDVPELSRVYRPCLHIEDGGTVYEHYIGPEANDEVLFDLLLMVKRRPFPFRQCPICRTIFVPVRKQKYCSPSCTTRAFSSAENPQRREYLRQRMAASRKKAKRTGQSRRGATPS